MLKLRYNVKSYASLPVTTLSRCLAKSGTISSMLTFFLRCRRPWREGKKLSSDALASDRFKSESVKKNALSLTHRSRFTLAYTSLVWL